MWYSIWYDWRLDRFIGYGVPATCEYPWCNAKIDRSVSYACNSWYHDWCWLFFCEHHKKYGVEGFEHPVCERCAKWEEPFPQKPEHEEWTRFMLIDKSWKEWRKKNPKKVQEMRESLKSKNAPK